MESPLSFHTHKGLEQPWIFVSSGGPGTKPPLPQILRDNCILQYSGRVDWAGKLGGKTAFARNLMGSLCKSSQRPVGLMKGEEMEAHKACPAAAWWRREFNPGLWDFRACALSTCFTASGRQGARRHLLVVQVRDDEAWPGQRWGESAEERLKRVRWLPGCGWEEERKVNSRFPG